MSPWHATGERMMCTSRALTRTLCGELDTHWAPDPWGWQDIVSGTSWRPEELESSLSRLTVPLISKPPRTVPILDERTQLDLAAAALAFLSIADATLADGVLAYRRQPDGSIGHYRAALATRAGLESVLYRDNAWVARADLTSFFSSVTTSKWVRALPPHLDVGDDLAAILERIEDVYGCVLPAGYAAARAIANVCLAEVDRALAPWPFTRWVDDYRVFTATRSQAERALTALRAAASERGFVVSSEKSDVLASCAARQLDVVSVTDHGNDPPFRPVTGEVLNERVLRFALRSATESGDPALLTALAQRPAEQAPATALPRLAAAIVAHPDLEVASSLLSALLAIDDDLANWRALRLAYAMWYLPQGVVDAILPRVLQVYERTTVVRPILLRVFARHASALVGELLDRYGGVSIRCGRLALAEATALCDRDAFAFPAPPLQSYL